MIYHRDPEGRHWRPTYTSHLSSFRRFSDHQCFYLNTAVPKVPGYLLDLDFDLVIFHYAFLAVRQVPDIFATEMERIAFVSKLNCPKAIVPHDEQAHADLLNEVVNRFGVTHIFTPASEPQWPQIYRDVDFERVVFHNVLTGYVDEATVRLTARRAKRHEGRSIDVGYRSWDTWPFYGRHGLLKGEVGAAFKQRAPEYGLVADISSDRRDALLGECWFDFLLDCKYTIGVEGGSSVFDWDGIVAQRTREYLESHENAPFEEVENACFRGLDGEFQYFLLGPRHFEAVMTKTCQVLIEGRYGGALLPGVHYIELKRDFSNLDEVLGLMKRDHLRGEMVERAYRDIVASGDWSYRALADLVFSSMLASENSDLLARPSAGSRLLLVWNRVGTSHAWERLQHALARVFRRRELHLRSPYVVARDAVVLTVGEERLWRFMVWARNLLRRLQGKPRLEVGEYVPTDAEVKRRANREGASDGKR